MLTCPGCCEELKSAWGTLSFACLGPLISINLPSLCLPPHLEQHPILPSLSSARGFPAGQPFTQSKTLTLVLCEKILGVHDTLTLDNWYIKPVKTLGLWLRMRLHLLG